MKDVFVYKCSRCGRPQGLVNTNTVYNNGERTITAELVPCLECCKPDIKESSPDPTFRKRPEVVVTAKMQ